MNIPPPPLQISMLTLRAPPLETLDHAIYHPVATTAVSTTHAITIRTKYLAHNAATPTLPVHHSAALALLEESFPTAFPTLHPTPTPSTSKKSNQKLPSTRRKLTPVPLALHVFAAPELLPSVTDLLAPIFTPTPNPSPCPAAYHSALLRTVRRALQSPAHVLLPSHILHADSKLLYTLSLSPTPSNTNILQIRTTISHTRLRPVTPHDILRNQNPSFPPLPLHIPSLPLSPVLAPRPPAGDALSASVLARWRDAGLLPATHLDTHTHTTVVFVRLPPSLDVPFPLAALLTSAPPHRQIHLQSTSARPLPKKLPPATSPRPVPSPPPAPPRRPKAPPQKSRKRPRSPVLPKMDVKKEAAIVDALAVSQAIFESDAPTASTLNRALDAARKQSGDDPVPILHHPFVEPIPPPCFLPPFQKEEVKLQAHGPTASETHDGPVLNKVENTVAFVGGSDPVVEKTGAVKHEVQAESEPPQNDIDSFLHEGDAAPKPPNDTSFDAGPSVDMTDFTVFDDEVAEFFDGMDERGTGPEDSALGTVDDVGISAHTVPGGDRLPDHDASLSQSGSDPNRHRPDGCMDVDTDFNKQSSDGPPLVQHPDPRLRAHDVMAMALSTLRKSSFVVPRPHDNVVGSTVSSFFEDDLTERRLVRLGPVGSLGKRRARVKMRTRRMLKANVNYDACSKPQDVAVSASTTDSFYAFSSQLPYKVGTTVSQKPIPDCYVPRRKLKAYYKLRRQGKTVPPSVPSLHSESEDSDCSDLDEFSMPEAHDGMTTKSDAKLEDLTKAALLESLAQETAHEKSDDAQKDDDSVEFNPHKIFESVAVDCASACMVLAASHAALANQPPVGTESGPTEMNGSPTLSQSDDTHKGNAGPVATKSIAHTLLPKLPGNAQNVSPIGRSATASKKDREMQTLLTLLEMQAFSVRELDLFRDSDSANKTDRLAPHRQDVGSNDKAQVVTAATVRRVLMGLPRLLETSQVFGNYNAAVREAENGSLVPLKVVGPVPVQDVLGEKAAVFPLTLPRICVGMNKDLVETSSSVLPLWEKSGLEPYSERKNVEYVAVGPKEIENDVRLFLRDVSAAYEECSFGRHAAMPFDAITLIANSKSKSDQRSRMKNPEVLFETDKAMSEQYHLAVTGLCTKLAAVTREHRKSLTDAPRNIVAYIISPFANSETAANVSLLRAVAPLVGGIPGTVPSMVTMLGSSATGSTLPSAPWRSTHASKSVVSITVRIIPREVVDRKLSGHAEIECLLERPLRPQLIKAVSFAVFSSIRSKRIRTSQMDGEASGMLARASLMPDDLMSPMTPEIVAESPGGSAATPVSPKGGSADESLGSPPTSFASHSAVFLDQSSALSPSYLHEPAVVLSGVGKHMGQAGGSADIVLHLAYTYCESASRFVFTWTDQRGEMLDTATVPISKTHSGASRRKAFWCMWARGQRWKISFVQEVHTTICKVGKLDECEVEDWDWVISKVLQADASTSDKRADEVPVHKVVRRFPRIEQSLGDDLSDLYTDHPTPATPGVSQPPSSVTTTKNTVSMDIKMPNVSSVTVLNVCPADEHLLLEISDRRTDTERPDFAIVSENSLSRGPNVQASAVLARFEESSVSAIELNVMRHYGTEPQGEDMTDDRSPWDGLSVQGIASSIVTNFHALRYVGVPPSWPSERWLTIYPVHVDIVRRFEMHIRHVQNLTSSPSTTSRAK